MDPQTTQDEVIRFLLDPALHAGAAVERIDTHASVIVLSGPRALKLKRAAKYDYLDYSTPDLRRQLCERELRINARLAPGLYKRVIPIVRTAAGALTLGGNGTPVEWVLEMARFDQEALLDRMATSGRLGIALMAPLAEEVAAFHGGCAVRSESGGEAGIARVIEGNAAAFRESGSGCFDPDACDRVIAAARAELRSRATLLERRRLDGLVRECHGDLHLGNIVLLEGRPTLFDAVEFNEDIANVDVMYDLAFLLMDLWHRRLPAHANVVLNAYLGQTSDFEGLAALPLFLSCRAAIRAKTTATAALLQATPDGTHEMQARAREYLDLAGRVLRRPAARIVAIGGLSGSGKSTVARALAPSVGVIPGAVVIRSDEIRKRLCGASPLTKLSPAAYTPEMSAYVYDAVVATARDVVASGHSAIVDAVCARPVDRRAIEGAAMLSGVPFTGVWLDAPERVLVERIERRGPDASDADAGIVRMQCAQWADDVRWTRIDAAAAPDTVQARVRAALESQAALDVAA